VSSRWDSIYSADDATTEKPGILGFVENMIYKDRANNKIEFRIGRSDTGVSFIVNDDLPQDTLVF
jgi:hypothetical protein